MLAYPILSSVNTSIAYLLTPRVSVKLMSIGVFGRMVCLTFESQRQTVQLHDHMFQNCLQFRGLKIT